MKKQLLSRRGAAIELAIGVMVLMLAISIVLLTNATIKHDRKDDDIIELENRVELYEVTDQIIADPTITEYNGYLISNDSGNYKITDSEGNTVLTIKIEDGKITSWK